MELELSNVKKQYKNFELDCTLSLKKGYVTGLVGRNGAGKSTTFKAILGLIKADSGSIKIGDKDIKQIDKKDKENIGVVLSDSGFSGYLTVNGIISIMEAMYSKFNKQEFISKCKYFEIPMNKKIKEFSTGMKAKLKILIAMSYGAKLLILDEPTSGLDVVAREEILNMLREYMDDEENSILISSHISGDLESLCDDIYMIENGKIIIHEDTNVLIDEYGILKVTKQQYEDLDKKYIVCKKGEKFGYSCLTNQKQFYLENYPEIAIEKSNIDDVITLLIFSLKGEVENEGIIY